MSTQPAALHRPDIDGLRAVAILLVVAFHAGVPGLRGGFVGVDVFFVISGFLITLLLVNEVTSGATINLRAFYARRVRRLLPALAVVLLVTLALGALVLPPAGEEQELGKSDIAAALFSSNFFFWRTSDYFAGPAELKPLLHTWTLAVEEQFYFVWPVLLLTLSHIATRLRAPLQRWLVIGVACVFVASLALSYLLTREAPTTAFYLMPARGWEFAIGGMLALVSPGWRADDRPSGTLATLLGLLGIGAAGVLFDQHTRFPGVAALLPTVSAGLVIAGGMVAPRNAASRLLSSKPMVLIGLLSYSWYLWHWPLLALARDYSMDRQDPLRDGVVAVGSLGLAALTYRYIENPIRFKRPGIFRTSAGALRAGAAISVLLVIGGVGVGLLARAESHGSNLRLAAVQATNDRPPLRRCAILAPYTGVLPSLDTCSVGDHRKAPTLLVWGDSHAIQLDTLAEEFARNSGIRVAMRAMYGCPPIPGVDPDMGSEPVDGCKGFNEDVAREVQRLRKGGLEGIILAARWPRYLGNAALDVTEGGGPWSLDASVHSPQEALRTVTSSLRQTVNRLTSLGLRVMILAPLPEMKYPASFCLVRKPASECTIERDAVERYRFEVLAAIRSVAAGSTMVRVWDPIDYFCDTRLCYPYRHSMILYRDGDHLTSTAARSLEPLAAPELRWLSHLSQQSAPALTETQARTATTAAPSAR